MNLVVLIGRLTRDPEIRYVQATGNYVTKFGIAVDRTFKTKDGVTADFFNITVWGKQAESCANYLAKGRQVAIQGRIENNNWTGEDGVKHYSTQIVASNVRFLDWGDNKSEGQGAPRSYDQGEDVFMDEETENSVGGLDEAGYRALSDDDVPF